MDFDGKFFGCNQSYSISLLCYTRFFCTNFRKEGALWMNI